MNEAFREHIFDLPVADRIILAQEILDSVLAEGAAMELTPEQAAEIDRRVAAADRGELAGEPWETVRAQLLAQCRPAS